MVDSFGLPEVVAAVMLLALNAYVLTGGADFGGGAWDLLARGPRRDEQRALIAHEIGPIWETNHVWLIVVIVVLFTAFPRAFATLSIVLHIPLTVVLLGIVLRGSSFVFRSYGSRSDTSQRRWGRIFAIASIATPVFLGITVGTLASGSVGLAADDMRPAVGTAQVTIRFTNVFVEPWLAPFPLVVGALALSMFAYLAAVYLALAARDPALREDFRRRALATGAVTAIVALAGLAVAWVEAPVMRGMLTSDGARVFWVATTLVAIASGWTLWTRRFVLARIAAAALVSLILWGWVIAQYPLLIPPSLTIRQAAAPRVTLQLVLVTLGAGSVILVPSLVYLYRTFAATRNPTAR